MKKVHCLAAVPIAALLIILASPVYADTYWVTNTNDSGNGSLREAISDATTHVGPDVIEFSVPTSDSGYDPATRSRSSSPSMSPSATNVVPLS